MLYTNYYGCCRLLQTTVKQCKVPRLKSTDLNRIQVTTLTCCNISQTALLHYAGYCHWYCDVTNVTYNENKYYVVT